MKLSGVSIILLLVACSYVAAGTIKFRNPVCCENLSLGEWRDAEVKYNISKGSLTKGDLYHSERYTIIGDAGSIDYKINEAMRKYYLSLTWRSDKGERRLFDYSKAPRVIGGKFSITVFAQKIHDILGETYPGYYVYNLNESYHCVGREFHKTLCQTNVFLMEYTVPYEATFTSDDNKCQCKSKGTYFIKNYPEIVFSKTSKMITN